MKLIILFFGFLPLLISLEVAVAQPTTPKSPALNPDLSLNGLFWYRAGQGGNRPTDLEEANGFSVQELELRLSSNIDAYWRGDAILALHRHAEEEAGETHFDYQLDPEEAYVESLGLESWTLRAGKFKAFLGRHNRLHTHAFPFVDAPLPHQLILGEEGLNEMGVSAAYLTPLPWYSEVVVQALQGENENLFASESQDDVVGLVLWKNLWDLNEATTFEWNLNQVNGRGPSQEVNKLSATAMTVKWKPTDSARKQSLAWTLEALYAELPGATDNQRRGGYSTWLQYQISRVWWVQLRNEYFGQPKEEEGITRKNSVLVGWIPSEYSALRLQYDHYRAPDSDEAEQRVTLQLNVSMGAHPAHEY